MKYKMPFCCALVLSMTFFACSSEKWCLHDYGYEDCDEVQEALDNATDSSEINDLQWINQECCE